MEYWGIEAKEEVDDQEDVKDGGECSNSMIMELKERIERAKEKSGKDGMFTSECEFSDEMMAIRRDFVTIHGEMVLLKNYNSLNFAATLRCTQEKGDAFWSSLLGIVYLRSSET
ncbi:SPX domain-containing protein 4 [Tanacetum coccineum]